MTTGASASDSPSLTDPPIAAADDAERIPLGGEWLQIRPIRPSDAKAHREFAGRLPAETLRFRFFTAAHAFSGAEIVRLTAVDHLTETAFIAVREASGETVGVVRLARLPGLTDGEFAIVVQADMQGKGLGALLMRRMIRWAREQGLALIKGVVLAENAAMLKLASRLGFELHREAAAPEVIEARLALVQPLGPGAAG